jgi:hypothetical protein
MFRASLGTCVRLISGAAPFSLSGIGTAKAYQKNNKKKKTRTIPTTARTASHLVFICKCLRFCVHPHIKCQYRGKFWNTLKEVEAEERKKEEEEIKPKRINL